MTIVYNDVDITSAIRVKACRFSEGDGRSDLLELELYDTAVWDAWQPQQDDIVKVTHNGFETGALYVLSLMPEGDSYTILASSLPARARISEFISFSNYSLANIIGTYAGKFRMGAALFGVDGDYTYNYLVQNNTSGVAALQHLIEMEGARLKCGMGRLNAISLAYAYSLPAALTLTLSPEQTGVTYTRCETDLLSQLTVTGVGVSGTAYDKACTYAKTKTFALLQAATAADARRWAAALLLNNNIKCEQITLDTAFNPYFTYLARVDVQGGSQMDGQHIITEAWHDFVLNRSGATLSRCREDIA